MRGESGAGKAGQGTSDEAEMSFYQETSTTKLSFIILHKIAVPSSKSIGIAAKTILSNLPRAVVMATSISAILISCLKSFNQLQERVEQPDYSHESEVSSVFWGDELGRLRVWAANIGAHQTGQSSLDFRLRDASHISNQITKLLQDLNRSLDDILDELSEDERKASEDDETEASWLDDNSTTELQQLHEEIINIIDCLY